MAVILLIFGVFALSVVLDPRRHRPPRREDGPIRRIMRCEP